MNDGEISPLQAEVDALLKRVEALEVLRDKVDQLADQIFADLEQNQRRRALGTITWVDLDADRAEAEFIDLRSWMTTVLIHHSPAMGVLRPCWYRHPAAVQALLDLRSAWTLAYRNPDPHGTVTFAMDFSQRHLPHFTKTLSQEFGGCTTSRHAPEAVPMPHVDENEVREYLRWWGGERHPAAEPPSR